jgi:hypothetical protein
LNHFVAMTRRLQLSESSLWINLRPFDFHQAEKITLGLGEAARSGGCLSVGDEGEDVAVEISDVEVGSAPGLFGERLRELYASSFKFLE